VPTLAPVFSPYVIFNATFEDGSDEFTYLHDGFRGTSNKFHTSGSIESTVDYKQVLVVKLGNRNFDNLTVTGLSGGWLRNFTIAHARNVSISITYQLEQSTFYESHEISQALCSIDNVLVSNNTGVDYLAQIQGDGDTGNDLVVGFITTTINMLLSAGTHTLRLGGYVSSRDSKYEETWIRFDDVSIWAL
jgi:hypothetical protein